MRRVLALAAAVAVLATMPAIAHAASPPADPDAPPAASSRWLPQEQWVMQRWLPFDEQRLYRVLGTTRDDVNRWLADSKRRTLQDLARRQGISRTSLVRRLVGPRRAAVNRAAYDRLRSRTARVVTQSHLSRHALFHTFHTWATRNAVRRALGFSPRQWKHLRVGRGMTQAQILRRRGVPVERVREAILTALSRSYGRGVSRRAMSPAQVLEQLADAQRRIIRWPRGLSRTSPQVDRGAPTLCKL